MVSSTWKGCAVLAVLLGLFGSALSAQYTRTETSGTYTERTGNGVGLNWIRLEANGDDNAALVNLPFVFNYFDRSYTQCLVSTNGRIHFGSESATTFSVNNLTPSAPADARDTIHGLGGDLRTKTGDPRYNLKQFNESGRVVFQWKDVVFFGGSGHVFMNFQIHLLSNGNIVMVYGPEFLPAGYTENTQSFSSGIVNYDGSSAVAGFGGVLTTQTTRPANGTTVTLTYSAPTPANFVRMTTNDTTVAPDHLRAPATNVPILSFKLTAVGSGNTITQLVFTHVDLSMSSLSATYALVRDTGKIGVYNGEAAIGTATVAGAAITVSGLSEAVTTGTSFNYLLLITLSASAPQRVEATVAAAPSSTMPADSVSGCGVQEATVYASGPTGSVAQSISDNSTKPLLAGSTGNVLFVCQVVRDDRSPAFALNELEFTLNYSGMLTSGDVSNLRLYRDGGTLGVLDGKDTLLASIANPATFNTFLFNQSIGTGGTNFLLTIDIRNTFTGTGSLSADLTDGVTNPVLSNVSNVGTLAGPAHVVIGTTAAVVVWSRNEVSLASLPVQPSDANVPATAFALSTNTGTAALSSLVFTEQSGDTTGMTAASLVIDNGTSPGRFDVGDTVVAGTLTINATNITVTGITGVTLGVTPTNFLLSVTFSAAASLISRRFNLNPADVTAAVTAYGENIVGTTMNSGLGSGMDGVDAAITFLGTSKDVAGTRAADLYRLSVTARGAGGAPPSVVFSALNSGGGLGNGGGYTGLLRTEVWLEGAGTLGVIDSTDRLLLGRIGDMAGTSIAGANAVVTTGTTRNYLIRIYRSPFNPHFPHTGRVDLAWRGAVGGTNVVLTSSIQPVTINTVFRYSAGGKKKDEGGCSTGSSESRINYALMAGALGLMFVALRLRRRAA